MCRTRVIVLTALLQLGCFLPVQGAPAIRHPGEAFLYRVLELEVTGLPVTGDPFDPDAVRLDATFSLPSGAELDLPGFWHQPYTSRQQNGGELLSPAGKAGWRLRFTPTEPGRHHVNAELRVNGVSTGFAQLEEMYRKRLRYLIARYGAFPNLLAWQFFNEIDNVYRHLSPGAVAGWHQEMGLWLKANDPWKHLVEVRNAGADWFYLDWVRLEHALPAGYANGWSPQPVVCGVKGRGEMLLYIVNPAANYPGNATTETIPPLTGARLTVPDVPTGRYQVRWTMPATGEVLLETTAEATDGELQLEPPAFSEDLAAQLIARDQLSLVEPRITENGEFAFRLRGEPAGAYAVEASPNLSDWSVAATAKHDSKDTPVQETASAEQRFYRARREP
jgi:hypothetical protein